MSDPTPSCLTELELLDLADGIPSPELRARAEAHLDGCPSCREQLAGFLRARAPSVVRAGADAPSVAEVTPPTQLAPRPPESPAPQLELQRGTTVGRFLILHAAGTGGMGTVHAAYDPELDRKVALKFLHAPGGTPLVENAQARLLREAQATARVSHPNVITLYDVGLHEGHVYMAMEYVEGSTVSEWLKAAPRSWREVLAVFRAAGQGLAAAHAAQLVHRDFKPSNVLIGKDGRVQVTDFGLARLATSREDAATQESLELLTKVPAGTPPRLHEALTRTGQIVGTLQYMAPEQLRGAAADARSDQFSFCAALYFALFGQRPFEPRRMLDALKQTRTRDTAEPQTAPLPSSSRRERKSFWTGSREATDKLPPLIQEPPREPRIPGWLKQAVMRGLSLSPEDRFASMEELLTHLSGPRSTTQRLWAAAIVGVIALVAYPLAFHELFTQPDPCAGAERKLAGAWDSTTQERIQRAFLASGRPYAASTWETMRKALDGYAERWARMQTQVCQATHERMQTADTGLAARQDCLEQRRVQMEALAQVLAQADGRMVDRAQDSLGALPALERCADVEALTRTVRPPTTSEAQAKVQDLQARLARVRALGTTGKHAEALALAEPLLAEARELKHAPLLAEALHEVASYRAKTGDAKTVTSLLLEAWWAAEAGREDALRAEMASELAYQVGFMEANSQGGRQWGRHSQAVLERMGGDDALQADLQLRLSAVAAREGQFAETKDLIERALALNDRVRGPRHPKRTYLLTNLGNAYTDLGQPQRGRELLEEALSLHDQLFGVGHPGSIVIRINLASVLTLLKDFQGAQHQLEQVIAAAPASIGAGHVLTGHAHRLLGSNFLEAGQFAEALQAHEKALAILEKALGADHPDVGLVLCNIGQVHVKQHQARTALPYLERSLAIGNPNASLLAETRFALAQALMELGRSPERVRELARQAREDFQAADMKEQTAQVEQFQTRLAGTLTR
ncbi:protein kinase domain-containing protein [Hyalangium versicolor]|uniref:protein kinase domain-containing protein n=1 Tax=Hyalangium versicolor TaxID=2861190 RepID=UPI001CC91CE8|nr:tetratricopeptide repeat protein [Hyalangium versicolor]